MSGRRYALPTNLFVSYAPYGAKPRKEQEMLRIKTNLVTLHLFPFIDELG